MPRPARRLSPWPEAAQLISAEIGRTITYRATDREAWIAAMVAAGIPAEYAQVLRPLTATVASGNGARPNGDVLAVTGVDNTVSPASVLELGVPIGRLDGQVASPLAWADLLMERLP